MSGSIKKHKYLFLWLSLLLVGGAAVFYFLFERDTANASEQYYTSSIQQRINKELILSQSEILQVGVQYQNAKSNTFQNLSLKTKYPYYIFSDGQLIYWSDHRLVPDYSVLTGGNYTTKTIQTPNTTLIVNKLAIKHQNKFIEIFSLINLYKKYKNENDYLKTGYNAEIFSTEPLSVDVTPSSKAYLNIKNTKGEFAFSIAPPQSEKLSLPNIPTKTLIILAIAILVFGVFVWQQMSYLMHQKHQYGRAFVIGTLYLLLFRGWMLLNSLPYIFYESDLFNPKYFSANSFSPSLGDFLLNALVICILLGYMVLNFYRSSFYYKILKSSSTIKSAVSVFCVLASIIVAYFCYQNLSSIYEKSQYLLDFSLSIIFSNLKLATLSVYLLIAVICFLANHILSTLFLRLNKTRKEGLLHWLYGFILGLILMVFVDTIRWAYIITGIYFAIVFLFKYSRYFYTFRYKTTIYFFLAAFAFALIAIGVISVQEVKKDIVEKQKFGLRYLAENDLLGEGLLTKVIKTISNDTAIVRAIENPTLARERIQQIVKSQHLDLYFDRYDTEVLSFRADGSTLDISDDAKSYMFYDTTYRQKKYQTSNADIYFVNEVGNNFIKQYVTFIPVKSNGALRGNIVLDLKLRDDLAESVYPELLMDKKFVQNPESKEYSYAIFDQNKKLIYSTGNYNYIRKFPMPLFKEPALFESGVELNSYYHVGVTGHNRMIVVSSKNTFWQNILSDFSFLYLLSVLMISGIITIYGIRYGFKNMNMNFATKIQLYLNAAFLLPLLLVIIITLSVIRATLVSIQEKSYIDNTKNIVSTLQLQLEGYENKKISRGFLEQEVNDLARDTKVDINLFDQNGRLDFSTRPLVYEYQLLSDYINPEAYKKIIEEKESETLLNESLGDLSYKTTYMNIKSREGKSLGVVGIPFFDAKTSLDRQVTQVVMYILSIFIFLFVLLLVISYFASNVLTNPLRLVAQKLKRTNLDKLNETLTWKSDDEIGLLMREYNKMLRKLEESKIALSQSEKQTAWREMAKQVAHEIKNPLTPMKLSIQQLQRTLPIDQENPKAKERIVRALNSLTEQIDNISEIANSFSEFAKMPVPRNEVFDWVPVIQKASDLYAENDNLTLSINFKDKEALVVGDRQFMSRVVTNLIINGIQSVPQDRRPKIDLRLYKNEEENFAILEVKDNGSGIADEVRKKVFIPNFSTKIGGSGLGLPMAKRGIEHAGGNIWFETEMGVGTTFYVDLPLARRIKL